jgi:hypothetical protein
MYTFLEAFGEKNYVFFVAILIKIGFDVYRFIKKRNSRPLWDPLDEEGLRAILRSIYSSSNLENLKIAFGEGIKDLPKYHDLIKVAMEEKKQEINPNNSEVLFEIREKKIRKRWILSFFTFHLQYWLFFVVIAPILLLPTEDSTSIFIAICTSIIGILMCIVYYFAYEKKGTVVLNLILVVVPLMLINYLAKANVSHYQEEFGFTYWNVMGFSLLAFGFYWFTSFRLCQVNKDVKALKQLAGLKAKCIIS